MSRTEKLRRLAARFNIEKNRLDALGDDLKAAGFPMCAKDVHRYAACCYSLSLSLDFSADQVRDKRGARRAQPQGEKP